MQIEQSRFEPARLNQKKDCSCGWSATNAIRQAVHHSPEMRKHSCDARVTSRKIKCRNRCNSSSRCWESSVTAMLVSVQSEGAVPKSNHWPATLRKFGRGMRTTYPDWLPDFAAVIPSEWKSNAITLTSPSRCWACVRSESESSTEDQTRPTRAESNYNRCIIWGPLASDMISWIRQSASLKISLRTFTPSISTTAILQRAWTTSLFRYIFKGVNEVGWYRASIEWVVRLYDAGILYEIEQELDLLSR